MHYSSFAVLKKKSDKIQFETICNHSNENTVTLKSKKNRSQ